jgi:steroid delta-isomerase-like uncharacterized protein
MKANAIRLLLAFVALLSACSRSSDSSPEVNRAVVHRYINEVWNKGNVALVDELVAQNYVDHDPANPPNLPPGATGLKQHISAMRAAFPDAHFEIEDMITEGDKVVTRWTVTGTHNGTLLGIAPTGKKVIVTGIWIDRIVGGRIQEEWANWDTAGLLRQIGATPSR